MHYDWMIPLPPTAGATAARGDTKRAVALYPCINSGECDQFLLVKLDARGNPYGSCTADEVTHMGCKKRSVKGAPEDIPPQTYEAYQAALARLDGLRPIPAAAKRYLDLVWQEYSPQTEDTEQTEGADDANACA